MKTAEASYFEGSRNRLVRWLGGPLYGRRRGRVKALNDLARAGLLVPVGVVLTEEAHEHFLKASGVLEHLKVAARSEEDPKQQVSEIRSHYRSVRMQEELNREICRGLIARLQPELQALSEDYEKQGLNAIPDVVDAVREAWLCADGLKWQIENVAAGEEIPTWPVLVQREVSPLYTGWSTVEDVPIEAPRVGDHLGKNKVALYDVEPFGREGHKGITYLTLAATSALGTRPRIIWELVDDIWYVLSIEMEEDEKLA
jgi:hypothetical protein